MTITTEYTESRKDGIRHEATWYAIGYSAGVGMHITREVAERFADSYADMYAEWLVSGYIAKYPVMVTSIRKWLTAEGLAA